MKISSKDVQGFSLLEVLVSTVILVIIVLIMSAIFQQSSIAWDAGTRKATGNMVGRSLLGMMSRELRNAVANPTNDFRSGNKIVFVTLTGPPGGSSRAAKLIKYEANGTTVKRSVSAWDGAHFNLQSDAPIAENVDALTFEPTYTDPATATASTVPSSMQIKFSLKKSANVSGVGASSSGPNGIANDADDIRSY